MYTIGGTISGLTGNGLVLQDNGRDNLAVAAGATTFTFNGAIAAGGNYAVIILSQAANQSCTVSNGSGIVTNTNINSIDIVCVGSGGGGFLYVTNQGNGASGGSLGVYSIGAAGSLTPLSGPPVPANMQPFALVADPQGQWLFVTDLRSGAIFTYQINPQTGALTESGTTSIGASGSVVIHPSGAWLYATVPDGAPGVYAFSVNGVTGALTSVPGSPFTSLGLRPTNIVLDPTGQFAFVSNNASATVAAFSINSLNGQLAPIGTIAAGTPGNAAVGVSSKSLYVMDDLAHVIRAFSIASNGSLAPLSTPVFQGVSDPLMPAISPSGHFLYVPNWSNGGTVPPHTVSVFSIDPSTGILGPVAGSPFATGMGPASVTIDSQGQFAYVANQAPNDISVFALNSSSGAMTLSSTATAGETPTRIAIVKPTSSAQPHSLTWYLSNVSFSEGTPSNVPPGLGPILATGFFTFNENTHSVLNWDITVSGATDPVINFEYTPSTSFIPSLYIFPTNNPGLQIRFVRSVPGYPTYNAFGTSPFDSNSVLIDLDFFASPGNAGLTNAGGTIGIHTGGTHTNDIALSTFNISQTGCVTTVPLSDPCPVSLSPNNVPGAHYQAVGWTDSSRSFWLSGGNGSDFVANEPWLNDLWKYSAGQWTWVSGAPFANQRGSSIRSSANSW
jgi:6-phosphogluconolactonase (cycloisomerase 2 family)